MAHAWRQTRTTTNAPALPDIKLSVRETFGIDTDLEVPAYSKTEAHVPDLDPDYRWAVVTDSTGLSGFLLTRDPIVSPDFYRELLARASVKGVKGRITPTRQPAAAADATSGAV